MSDNELIVAIESSGRSGSIAVGIDDKIVEQQPFTKSLRHGAELLPKIDNILRNIQKQTSQLTQVYISIGPGSFTGLRIAVTAAKMMALSNHVKIVEVDTMDILAERVFDDNIISAQDDLLGTVLDAKRGEFFVAVYRNLDGKVEKVLDTCCMIAEQFLDNTLNGCETLWLCGEGLMYYKEKFNLKKVKFLEDKYWTPQSSTLYKLGWQKAQKGLFTDPQVLKPKYLRSPDVKVKS